MLTLTAHHTAICALALLCVLGPGCDLARPDALPPRGDEQLVERARQRLRVNVQARTPDGRCKRKRRYYRDADKDGFGDRTASVEACFPPEGYVANGDDCYDKNPRARPDQKDYFHVHRGDGSFDYDCDEKESVRFPDRGYCRLKMAGNGCVHVSGWQGLKVPKCGHAAAWHWYACHEIHTPVLPEPAPAPAPRPAPTPAPGSGAKATGAPATGGPSGGSPGGTTAPGSRPTSGSPARPATRPARPAGTTGGPGHRLEPVRPGTDPATTPAPRPAPTTAPQPTVPRVRRRTAAAARPVEPSTRTVETRVRYRCAGRLTPWKKMQLCR